MAEMQHADPAPDPNELPAGEGSEAPLAAAETNRIPPSNSVMRYILFALFVLTILGLGYDQWARHKARAACELVEAAIENQDRDNRLNSDAVRQLLERQPDSTVSDETSEREIYRWRGTLLWYDVTVEYSKAGELRDVRLGGE